MEDFKYKDLTYKIIGCAMNVHNELGNGFQEVIYQRALAWEFNQANIDFVREQNQEIFYKNCPEPIGTKRADFVVESSVLVELKATSSLTDVHYAQILNYLKAYRYEIGLLINFGHKKLEYKRFIL